MRFFDSMTLAFFVTSCAPAPTRTPPEPPPPASSPELAPVEAASTPPQSQRAPDAFFLDGDAVDRETYETFRATLSEVPGTRECEETVWGGADLWRAVDSQGNVYQVVESTEPEGDRYDIYPTPRVEGTVAVP